MGTAGLAVVMAEDLEDSEAQAEAVTAAEKGAARLDWAVAVSGAETAAVDWAAVGTVAVMAAAGLVVAEAAADWAVGTVVLGLGAVGLVVVDCS